MKNTADMTGGKPIAVLLQSISGVCGINPLFAFYDIHGGKREVLFFYFACVMDSRPDKYTFFLKIHTTQTQYKQTCSCTQMLVLCGNGTRDLLRNRRVFGPMRESVFK
jgi:hypothetical protein